MIFRPRGANRFEKIKATAVANDIKNEDHAGKGRVEMFDESENDDMTRFFAALGSGSISEVSILETNDNDFEYMPKLYRIFGNTYSPVYQQADSLPCLPATPSPSGYHVQSYPADELYNFCPVGLLYIDLPKV